MAKAMSIACFLCIHPEVDHVYQNLHMTLWLHGSPHDSKAHERLVVFGDKGGDDCVEGTFSWEVGINVIFCEGK